MGFRIGVYSRKVPSTSLVRNPNTQESNPPYRTSMAKPIYGRRFCEEPHGIHKRHTSSGFKLSIRRNPLAPLRGKRKRRSIANKLDEVIIVLVAHYLRSKLYEGTNHPNHQSTKVPPVMDCPCAVCLRLAFETLTLDLPQRAFLHRN